uniref:Uncharacterized protein n=1 Tax=Tanacetum cinerariifolium TaxID=118510 RepID=A0A699H4X4_TANCI|nr:hypothetical protein [Tanacetum cinerariifolium]
MPPMIPPTIIPPLTVLEPITPIPYATFPVHDTVALSPREVQRMPGPLPTQHQDAIPTPSPSNAAHTPTPSTSNDAHPYTPKAQQQQTTQTANTNSNPASILPMVTRFCDGTTRPTQRLNLYVTSVSPLPKSYRDAFNDLN